MDIKKSGFDTSYYSYEGYYGYGGFGYGYNYEDYYSTKKKDDSVSWKERYKSRYKSSFGWGSGRLIESTKNTYSREYWGYKSSSSYDSVEKTHALIRKTYKAARDLVVILGFPFNILIQLTTSGEELNCDKLKYKGKNYRILKLPTAPLDENKKYPDEQERINIVCGLGIHEAAHLKYTSVLVLRKFMDYVEDKEKISVTEEIVAEGLINIIEDERIENLLLSERPGYFDFIDKAKTYQYQKFIEITTGKKDVDIFLYNLFRLLRYPENIDEVILEKYKDKYKKIRECLIPYPQSTKDSCVAGYKIFKIIKDILPEFKISDETVFFDNVRKILNPLFRVVSSGEDFQFDDTTLPESDIMQDILNGSDIVPKLISGAAFSGEGSKTYFEKVIGNKEKYNKIAGSIRKYVPAIRKILIGKDRNYDFNIYGCRSGILDTTKLAEAYQGVPQVYIRSGHVKTNKTTVCILIDESGSMCYSGRYQKARETAILLNEAFKSLPGIDLYIYGHTADVVYDGSTDLRIYKEGNTVDSYALSEVHAISENRDGVAIYEASKRVRKFTKSHCIMFVISDGSPCAHGYHGYSAYNDVRSKVKKVEADGFDVIQISIDRIKDVELMFDKHIYLRDLSKLHTELSQIVKKAILSDKKTIVSTE